MECSGFTNLVEVSLESICNFKPLKSTTLCFTFKNSTGCKVKLPDGILLPSDSPSKHRRLRVSVSCDNYLNDAKFVLSRRDSVGSGSPRSSKGSPLRWATKPDELVPLWNISCLNSHWIKMFFFRQ